MKKITKIILGIGIGYVVFLIIFGFIINSQKWSWWIMFWFIAVPIIGGVIAFLITRFTKGKKKADRVEGELPDLDIDKLMEFVKQWIYSSKDSPIDIPIIKSIQPITPKQEGDNKQSLNKVRVEGYWGENYGGFDIMYLATDRKKKLVKMFHTYNKDDKTAENDFDERLNKSVINPEKYAEAVEEIQDALGNLRTIRKKTPMAYLKMAEEQKQTKETEKEEGASE